jgi:hypothetical protein
MKTEHETYLYNLLKQIESLCNETGVCTHEDGIDLKNQIIDICIKKDEPFLTKPIKKNEPKCWICGAGELDYAPLIKKGNDIYHECCNEYFQLISFESFLMQIQKDNIGNQPELEKLLANLKIEICKYAGHREYPEDKKD